MALEFLRAGRGVTNWPRCLGFDYEAFVDVVGRVGVLVFSSSEPLSRFKLTNQDANVKLTG